VAVADVVDGTAEVFADILCSDPEWVDAEFEQIVSGFWDEPTSSTAPSRPLSVATHSGRRTTREFFPDPRSSGPRATIRSPP
jgi:hypothetical protein